MSFTVNITKRLRTRRLSDGSTVKQARWVANYTDPLSGKRRQQFFDTHNSPLTKSGAADSV